MNDLPLRRIFGFFACSFVVIATVAVLSVRQINRSTSSSDWVNQTHSAIHQFESILSSLHLAEGMMRTYVVTSDPRDKEATNDAFAEVDEHFAYAKALVRDREEVLAEVEQLNVLSSQRRDFAEAVWAAHARGETEATKQLLLQDAGLKTKSAIRSGLEKLRNDHFELLTARDRESFRQAQTTGWIVGSGVALNLLLFTAVGWLIREDLARRVRLAQALQEANRELDERVQLRTQELKAANSELEEENLERQWTIKSQAHQLRYNEVILGAIHDVVLVLSKVLHIARVNPAASGATGCAEPALLGQPLTQFVLPRHASSAADSEREIEAWRATISAGRELTRHPVTIRNGNGESVHGLMTIVPIRDADRVVGAVAVIKTETFLNSALSTSA